MVVIVISHDDDLDIIWYDMIWYDINIVLSLMHYYIIITYSTSLNELSISWPNIKKQNKKKKKLKLWLDMSHNIFVSFIYKIYLHV